VGFRLLVGDHAIHTANRTEGLRGFVTFVKGVRFPGRQVRWAAPGKWLGALAGLPTPLGSAANLGHREAATDLAGEQVRDFGVSGHRLDRSGGRIPRASRIRYDYPIHGRLSYGIKQWGAAASGTTDLAPIGQPFGTR
jgi:hypothetical protein